MGKSAADLWRDLGIGKTGYIEKGDGGGPASKSIHTSRGVLSISNLMGNPCGEDHAKRELSVYKAKGENQPEERGMQNRG